MAPRTWDKEAMIQAIHSVKTKSMGYKAASKAFNVPRATLCMYVRAATMETAVNGFRKTGIIPYNPNIFSDVDFVAQIQSHYVNGTPATQMDSNPPTSPSSASTVSPQQIRAVPVI